MATVPYGVRWSWTIPPDPLQLQQSVPPWHMGPRLPNCRCCLPRLDQGTIKLNASAKPKALDITGTEGPNKGKTIRGIYEQDGDTLRVCCDLSGKSRPKELKTSEGTKLFVVTYKRQKP
jgi:hypothetical protein